MMLEKQKPCRHIFSAMVDEKVFLFPFFVDIMS